MKRHEQLKSALSGLAKLQVTLDAIGGPEKDSELFECILSLQSGILKSLGLPEKKEFLSLLWFKKEPTLSDIDHLEQVLHNSAKSYLLSNTKTEIQILTEAMEQKIDAFNVLPELNISTHVYTLFIYNNILLLRKDTVENIFIALQKAKNNNILNLLGVVVNQPKEKVQAEIKYLLEYGIKYLNEFIAFHEKQEEMKQPTKLNKLSFFLNNEFSQFGNLEEAFKEYAKFLMNDIAIVVADQPYRIIECEVYYHCPEMHPDPYVHKRDNQLNSGAWYFNDSGLDITFGNREKGVFASFLIRGIRQLQGHEKLVTGTANVVREIFNQFGHITNYNNGIGIFELQKGISKEEPISVTRVGLTKQQVDTNNFIEKPYRFIVELSPNHKFRDKEKVVKQLFSKGDITKERAKEILGYNVGF